LFHLVLLHAHYASFVASRAFLVSLAFDRLARLHRVVALVARSNRRRARAPFVGFITDISAGSCARRFAAKPSPPSPSRAFVCAFAPLSALRIPSIAVVRAVRAPFAP
jgi:hypothetical protein